MEKYFNYLDWLRSTGAINMLGAVPYLQEVFPELNSDRSRACDILQAWMKQYSGKQERVR